LVAISLHTNNFILKYGGNNHAKSELIQQKLERIEFCKKTKGTRNHRKLQKYSEKFNEIFNFFLKSYRSRILTFCGYDVKVEFDINSDNGKFGFRRFENGEIKIHNLKSCHPNILKGVIVGKKSWGLHQDMWTDGIIECSFTKDEILEQFYEKGIKIPEPFLLDFDNTVLRKKIKRNDFEIEKLKLLGLR